MASATEIAAQQLQEENRLLRKRLATLELAKESKELRSTMEALAPGKVLPLLCCQTDGIFCLLYVARKTLSAKTPKFGEIEVISGHLG